MLCHHDGFQLLLCQAGLAPDAVDESLCGGLLSRWRTALLQLCVNSDVDVPKPVVLVGAFLGRDDVTASLIATCVRRMLIACG